MRIQRPQSRVFGSALFLVTMLLGLASSDAAATSFGDSTIMLHTANPTCIDGQTALIVALPVTVSTASRIFASVSMSGVYANQPGTVWAALTTAADQFTVLGSTVSALATSQSPVIAQSVLHEGATPIDSTAIPLVLQPGNYQLQLRVLDTGSICSGYFSWSVAVLTYVLLSASFDQIFADGFA